MKKLVLAAAVAVAALTGTAHAAPVDGNWIMRWCQSQNLTACNFYLLGLAEGSQTVTCMPAGVITNQMRVIVLRWLRSRPQVWHLHGATLVVDAYKAAWSCQTTQPTRSTNTQPTNTQPHR